MTILREKNLTFTFPDTLTAMKLDSWPRFRAWSDAAPNRKGVDILAYDRRTAWFLEVKDFRLQDRSPKAKNSSRLPATVDAKVRCSIDGLNAIGNAPAAARKRVVLHLEPPPHGSSLFPSELQTTNILQKLRQLVRDIDPQPLVLRISTTPKARVPWTVK